MQVDPPPLTEAHCLFEPLAAHAVGSQVGGVNALLPLPLPVVPLPPLVVPVADPVPALPE